MEVVVTEEKKKIFRARKTMKISDRQQLETLHNALLSTPSVSETSSSSPLMNGTHKDDGPKAGDKEQNNVSDSNSPRATSPASPASLSSPSPFLSLNLSPSPASSQSPPAKEDAPISPTSPFHSLNFELKKMEHDEVEGEEKGGSSSKDGVASSKPKESGEKDEMVPEKKAEEEEPTKTDNLDVKDSKKGSAPSSPEPAPVSGSTEPMDVDSDTAMAKDMEVSKAKVKEEKPYSPKSTTSDSPSPCTSSSHPASSSSVEINKEKDIKTEKIKEEKDDKDKGKKGSLKEEKMEVDTVKTEPKKEKTEVRKTPKPSRPSSTPPSDTVKEEKPSSGLKRTLSEGHEQDEQQPVKQEGKRPKVEREELEAQLELKITANSGGHHKLEQIVQKLVDERLRVLELTIFDKHFDELKTRVDKIDCASKHQSAINTLQAKIARLAKKFGEANQAAENKRKNEALAAAAAAKSSTASTNPPAQRELRPQTVEMKPKGPREGMAPSVGEIPVLSIMEERHAEEMEEDEFSSRDIAMANKLAEYAEGKCREDIKLRTITSDLESVLYQNCKRSSGFPRSDRYASYIFRYLVPYEVYCDWVAKVNYVGVMGKDALPTNLRKTMRMYIDHRFPLLSCDAWREIRDVINEILRVKRRPDFFREYEARSVGLF